jgi:hypothetical protein
MIDAGGLGGRLLGNGLATPPSECASERAGLAEVFVLHHAMG